MPIPAIGPTTRAYSILSVSLWPLLYGGGLLGAYFAFRSERPVLWFNAVYLSVVLAIGVFERLMPYARRWHHSDGEAFNDVAHTLMSKGLVQVVAAVGASFPLLVATFAQPVLATHNGLWPTHWPLFAQVVLGLFLAEFGLYWAHRLAHERLTFWRFHALHHSVVRLWVVNTGRFHIVDSLFKAILSQVPLYLLGAPLPVFLWIGAVTAFTGLLTHCNIDVRTANAGVAGVSGSVTVRSGTTSSGNSGTIARGFLRQLAQPFSAAGLREILGGRPAEAQE